MGFFDKLFGGSSSNDNNLEKTSELMNEDLYWKIIQASLPKPFAQHKQKENLIQQLQKLPAKEIVRFKLRTDKLMFDIYNSEMWCAAYIINGGCSDDGFTYFRGWIISRGKEVYYKSKSNPDNLIDELDDEPDEYEFEDFLYAANDAFEAKTEKDLYDFIDNENLKFNEGEVNIEFTWEEEAPETMKAICPNLFEAKWH
jgi:hypothetical protein